MVEKWGCQVTQRPGCPISHDLNPSFQNQIYLTYNHVSQWTHFTDEKMEPLQGQYRIYGKPRALHPKTPEHAK